MEHTLSDQVSRNRSTSAGTSGLPQHEHKRPRLETAQDQPMAPAQASETVMAEAPRSRTVSPQPPAPPATEVTPPPGLSVEASGGAATISPTSKMTISIRPLSAQSVVEDGLGGDASHVLDASQAVPSHSAEVDPADPSRDNASGHVANPITIASSPENDEEDIHIEIGVPEDIIEADAQASIEAEDSQRRPWEFFPYLSNGTRQEAIGFIATISEMFESQNSSSLQGVLSEVTKWLLEVAPLLNSQSSSAIAEDSSFYTHLPLLMQGLLKRRTLLPNDVTEAVLLAFIKAYASFSFSVAKLDIKRLAAVDNAASLDPQPWLYCLDYLNLLVVAMSSGNSNSLNAAVRTSRRIDIPEFIGMVVNAVLSDSPAESLQILSDLLNVSAEKYPITSAKRYNLVALISNFRVMLQATSLYVKDLGQSNKGALQNCVHQFLIFTDSIMSQAIAKQHPWLTIDNCQEVQEHICRLVNVSVLSFPDLAADAFNKAQIPAFNSISQAVPDLAHDAYKLALLKQLIQHGRMELRVFGIETMAGMFVETWGKSQKMPESRRSLLVQFVIDFLRQNEMVKYILGVDSHPQIIHRSSNVIGFLCVSHNWRSQDTDTAWRTILESDDPRSAAAVFETLTHNSQHLNVKSLLYLIEKLHETPFGKFDIRMVNFGLDILSRIKVRSNDQPTECVPDANAKVVAVCLHLLRESQTPTNLCLDVAEHTRQHIYDMLGQHLVTDMDNFEVENLLSSISHDIVCHNDHATGSIIGLTAILLNQDNSVASAIVSTYKFARLLVDDVAILAHHRPNSAESRRGLEVQYSVRFKALQCLLLKTPEAFDEELMQSFWNSVLAADLARVIRSQAWTTLAEVIDEVDSTNGLLDFVYIQFMNYLPSAYFDSSVLTFAKLYATFEMRHGTENGSISDVGLSLPALEGVWRILLESPSSLVEQEAAKFIVHIYLDDPVLTKRTPTSIENTHSALVDRIIQTVIDSARLIGDGKKTPLVPTDQIGYEDPVELATTQHRVNRSLGLLRLFLNEMKTRSRYKASASEAIGPALTSFTKRGEPMTISIRIAGHPRARDEQVPWTIGKENTGREVWQFLTELTGWSQINVLNAGTRLSLHDSQDAMKNIKINFGPLMISKAMYATDIGTSRATRASSPVDSKVMHHFSDLYSLLEFQEPIAKAVFDFLTIFSSQEAIVAEIRAMDKSGDSLLPVAKPYKLLYFASALRSCIEEESFSKTPNSQFLLYAVQITTETLLRVQNSNLEKSLRRAILKSIIEALQLALKAKVPEDVSHGYFTERNKFVDAILASWATAQSTADGTSGDILGRDIFEVVIEAAIHDKQLWEFLEADDRFVKLIAAVMLDDKGIDAKRGIQTVICRLAGVSDTKATKTNDSRNPRMRFSADAITECLQHVWHIMRPLVGEACEKPASCQELLVASHALLQSVAKSLDLATLTTLYLDLKALLLKDTHAYGPFSNEHVIGGLAKLLSLSTQTFKARNEEAPDGLDLAIKCCQKFLFPTLSDDACASLAQQNIPLVDTAARTACYDVLLATANTETVLHAIISELQDCTIDMDAFICHSINERKALKCDEGYAGLQNLSNTCYLNSLFAQLFMNLRFRELITRMEIIDEQKQKLVAELANVFAAMQSSVEKFVVPEEAVDSITQYTGEQIDVTVQMDVDEFFNLLFDRLETQIVDQPTRDAFKRMYGGELVQQIKSKECEHVSERVEPFSAIQIEIRGKAGLQEGLAAYVEGEVLQGENKYSCTSCAKHVDAVKRACIKEMPDNLIFNLKRFDYDIMTGMRTKVNDEFEFPHQIDMMPYTVEALSHPEQSYPSDVFELVGVIVHSGTAETGHYYSYIRQRPSSKDSKDSWVQFNDSDVTYFDPSELKEQAFGGCDPRFSALSKFYNGYMLFYQRSTSIRQFEEDFPITNPKQPVSLDLPPALDNQVAMQNEICMRRYVLQDPSHAEFVRSITEKMRLGKDHCSQSHETEDKLLPIVLDYMHQVSTRWKDSPEVEETTNILVRYAQGCFRCASRILAWFEADSNVTNSIVRAWYVCGRRNFALLLTTTCCKLFPLRHSDTVPLPIRNAIDESLRNTFTKIVSEWSQLQRSPRSWEFFFQFLYSVAALGSRERLFLIELNFLEKAAELVWIQAGPSAKGTLKIVRQAYNMYLAAREKNRSFNHAMATQFFALLFQGIELDTKCLVDNQQTLRPSETENHLLQLQGDGQFEWLRRLIHFSNSQEAGEAVVRYMCQYPQLAERMRDTLVPGVERTLEYHAAARFVGPCLVFVSGVSNKRIAFETVRRTLCAVADTDGYCSKEYFDYVQALTRIETTVSGLDKQDIIQHVLKYAGQWAPMLLLASNDMHHDVRGDTLILLQDILLRDLLESDVQEVKDEENVMAIIRTLVKGCVEHATKNFLSTNQQRSAPRLTYMSGQNRQIIELLSQLENFLDTGNAEDDENLTEMKNTIAELQMLDSLTEDDQLNWGENSEPLSEVEFSEMEP